MSAGILSTAQVKDLIKPKNGGTPRLYRPSGLPLDSLLTESAIDLPLGDQYWEMKGSCRTWQSDKVTDLIKKYAKNSTPTTLGEAVVTLRKHTVYLFKADCELDLYGLGLHQGRATGKSSVGRLDVLVRLLVGKSDAFDIVQGGSKHEELYIEVTPISFDLQVKQGTTLSQLRLYKGDEKDISLTMEQLYNEDDDNFPVVDEHGQPYRQPCANRPQDIWFPFRLDLTPDPVAKCCAFRARKDKGLSPIDPGKKKFYDPKKYWEPIPWYTKEDILLEPDFLYILRSKERLRIPAHFALECKSYTTEMGEWRIEYAGFAHPFFGRSRASGTPIIFEVRGHNVQTILTHGIPLGNVRFLRMSKDAQQTEEPPSYEMQELALSKCFKNWRAA
jgi:dCTP deaminase